MDRKIRNLQRLSATDPEAKDRYIRALERLAGMGEPSEEAKLKCLVENCPNHANEGHGLYLLIQPNKPGEAPYTWDDAAGPLFICGPCYRNLKKAPWRQASGAYSPFTQGGSVYIQGGQGAAGLNGGNVTIQSGYGHTYGAQGVQGPTGYGTLPTDLSDHLS